MASASLKEMIKPGALAIISPMVIGEFYSLFIVNFVEIYIIYIILVHLDIRDFNVNRLGSKYEKVDL